MKWIKGYSQHLYENVSLTLDSFWERELKIHASTLATENMEAFFGDWGTPGLPKKVLYALKSEGWECVDHGTDGFWVQYCHVLTEADDFGDGPFIKIIIEIDPPNDIIRASGEFWLDPGHFEPDITIPLERSTIKNVNFELGNPRKYKQTTPDLIISVAKDALQELREEFVKVNNVKFLELIRKTMLKNPRNWIFNQLYNGDASLFPGGEENLIRLFGDIQNKAIRVEKVRNLFGK